MTTLFSEAYRRDPYPPLASLRDRGPVFRDPASGTWMLLRYDDVKRALANHDAFSSAVSPPGTLTSDWLIFADPPRHARLRALIMRAFTPRAVAALEHRIRARVSMLLDDAERGEEVDFVRDIAVPLPLAVIAEMLGAPTDDLTRFRGWTDAIVALSHTVTGGPNVQRAVDGARRADTQMREYLPSLIEERRMQARDDLLSRLVHADLDGERMSENEILGFFQLLLLAGHETTTNLLGNAVLGFDEHPDQLALLRAAPGLLEPAVEEVLRFRSPVQTVFRYTRRDVRVGDETIPAGAMVLLMLGAANRDPARFDRPDRFDIARDPNPHVGFGHGIHYCIGAPLARLEARVALEELYRRVERVERVDHSPWEPREAFHVHGPSRLPVRLVPRQFSKR
jgi:cytochrome P450